VDQVRRGWGVVPSTGRLAPIAGFSSNPKQSSTHWRRA
jgi:hypothetical protein